MAKLRIAAVMPVYNEEDIIYHSVKYLVDQGIKVYVIDNESTDSTRIILSKFSPSQVRLYSLNTGNKHNLQIANEKIEELCVELDNQYDWLMKNDADEFWESPYERQTLREGIEHVDRLGQYNCIGIKELLFYPLAKENPHKNGEDVRKYYNNYKVFDNQVFFGSNIYANYKELWKTVLFKCREGLSYVNPHLIMPESKIRLYPDLFPVRHYTYRDPVRTAKRLIKERKERLSEWNIMNNVSVHYAKYNYGDTFLFDQMVGLQKWSQFKKPLFKGFNEIVSIIIPCWNGQDYIGKCFNSIRAQSYKNIEVIVIDNGSADSSKDMIRNDFADLHPVLIENPKNFGFAKAMNQGIAASKGEFVFALNMDVVLEPDYIEKLVAAMSSNEVGSATGKLYRFLKDWGGRKILDSTGHIFLASESVINRGEEEEDTGQYDSDKAIFGVSAAAAMYKREMLEDVKMGGEYFDEDFFVSFEDVDLDWRANLRGWKSIYVPEAVAYHKRYGTNWPLDEKLLINAKRNKLLLVIKDDFAFNYLLNFPFVFAYGFEDFLYNHFKNYRLVIGSFIRFIMAVPWVVRKRFMVKKMRRITFSGFRRHVNIMGKDIRKLFDVTGTFITTGVLIYFFGAKNTLLFAIFVFFILNPAVFYLRRLAEKPGE